MGHRHGLGGGGGLVKQRCIGQLHAGQIHHHLLEVQQGFHPALTDLGLIGRIGGIPAGVFQHVAQDHARQHRAVIAHAQHGNEDLVSPGHLAQIGKRHALALGRFEVQGAFRPESRQAPWRRSGPRASRGRAQPASPATGARPVRYDGARSPRASCSPRAYSVPSPSDGPPHRLAPMPCGTGLSSQFFSLRQRAPCRPLRP